jgi:hypothetical protein
MLLAAVLCAVAIRVPFVLFETPVSRDITEFQNVARHLGDGDGFTLSIRAYYQFEAPVNHYSGFVRPWMLPLMLAAAQTVFSEALVSQVLPPILFIVALAWIYAALIRCYSTPAAFCAVLALALHPGLRQLSLMPFSELTVIFFIALAIWAYIRWNSPTLVGLACALAFLSRPGAAMVAVAFGAAYAARSSRVSSFRPLALHAAMFLLGPAVAAMINVVHGAPLFQTPQNFLFRIVHFSDGMHYLHRHPMYDSAVSFLSHNAGLAFTLVANNAASYALQMVAGQSGLMYLLPLVPLAIIGAIGSPRRELVTLLAVIGALDLTVSTLTWSTYDGWRFLLVFAFTWIPWIIAESWEALTELARGSGRRWRSVPAFVIAVVVGVWGLRDLAAAFVAFREHQHDRPLVWYDELWDSPDVRAMKPRLPTQGAVIASNEPWLANRLTGRPAALVPYDLNPEEWMPFLQRIGATHVFLHGGDWPQPYDSNRQSLLASLAASGWRRVAEQGQLQLWMSDAFESSK